MENKQGNSLRKLVVAGICLALALLLPFLTGNIPQFGRALSPMHIPVLLCGFICGPYYGLIVGFVAPILRFVMFGMPPIFPTGFAMAFELATYGLISGILYKMLPKKTSYIYVSLIGAMIVGRIVWGVATAALLGINGTPFTFAAFMAGAIINVIPGIIVHIILIPAIVIALKKSNLDLA